MEQQRLSSRTSHRFSVAYPVIFCGAPFVGEGQLFNLSLTGCSITGHRTVLQGSYVKLNVLLPHPHTALLVELGRVRWVRGHSFGIEFIRWPTLAHQRLDRVVWECLTWSLQNTPRLLYT